MVSKSKLNPVHGKKGSIITRFIKTVKPLIYKGSRRLRLQIGLALAAFTAILYILSSLFGYQAFRYKESYPDAHGIYLNEIQASTPLIYPYIEHTSVLKELGLNGLFVFRTFPENQQAFVIKADDKPLTGDEIKRTTDQILLVKRSFLDHAKLVYKKKPGPNVVLLTIIDFQKYSAETLVKIVQNRVDYAQKHGYGIHIRWLQEFIPLLEFQNNEQDYEFIKTMAVRATMHAFPNSKYIFYLEQESLIMNMGLTIEKNIINEEVLDLAVQKRSPIQGGSNILTHSDMNIDDIHVFVTRSEDESIDTDAMIIRNSLFGKSFTEYLSDPLYRDYNWDKYRSSITHLLQWHPKMLSHTAIVIPRLIGSIYDPSQNIDDKKDGDIFHYSTGDFVVSMRGCQDRGSCASDINTFYSLIKK